MKKAIGLLMSIGVSCGAAFAAGDASLHPLKTFRLSPCYFIPNADAGPDHRRLVDNPEVYAFARTLCR